MIKENDILELETEKAVFEGMALARYEGMTIFVNNSLPNEKVCAKIKKVNKSYARAELVSVIEPSKRRIKSFCPLSKPCGGCDLSFADYDYTIELKEKIVEEIFQNFKDLEIFPMVKSPKDKEYRSKTQYPITQTKNSKRVVAGYYKEATHEIVNIKYCPIQPSIIDDIVQFTRDNWKLSCYLEKKHKGLLRHLNTRISDNNGEILLTFVLNADESVYEKNKAEIISFVDSVVEKFKAVKGVLINLNPDKTNKITGAKTILVKGEDYLIQTLKEKRYKIGVNSFFQVNPACAVKLFETACNYIEKRGTLLDLYGGVGTIGIFLKDFATKITLVEENKEAVKFAKENFKLNNVEKYEVFEGSALSLMKDFIKEKRRFENVIIDPPRKGSDKDTLNLLSMMTDSLIYISCNPMTLKRDAEILSEKGFVFEKLTPVDMFPYTHHIELVARFKRVSK